MFPVRISLQEDSALLPALARLALDKDDKADLLDELGLNLVESARLRFIDQVDPDGNPWKPSIRAQKQGGETLRNTGRLMNSLTHRVDGDSVEYGTNVDYALPLHYGADIKPVASKYLTFRIPGVGFVRKKQVILPARPILGLSQEDGEATLDIINNFLQAGR